MLQYREFLSLTDEEIKFILTEMFNPTKIVNIERDKEWNKITVEMTTGGWDDGEGGEFEIEDIITLKMPTVYDCGLEVDFSLTSEDKLKWEQFLLAKGCDYRLKDNSYMEEC
ncbi:hypothetical protein [Mediterraneibacter gnavus]|uniref:hypothetical protein n=1 Tax=Mediterraneibacter gnavus TaxID=33038 RepID=UPI00021357BA|nr:hypothetical protein [Mediterraneibacter gnavus]EGN45333.1 hypothetical protein HMPREF0991_02736 [Lachnospiraceae bacterium 2_1_58FAA]